MKVLVFGANGFLGKELIKLLKDNKVDCYTVSRTDATSNYNVDISNFDSFNSLEDNKFNVIINCATILPGGNFLDSNYLETIYKTNILGTHNICKWIEKQTTVTKIVNCSTLVVVNKPWATPLTENAATYPSGRHVLYCSSKLMQELIMTSFVENKSINLTNLRFSSLYGKSMNWNGLICNLIDQARNNKEIKITNGSKVSADFLHVNDAAAIILKLIFSNYNGILNGASGVEISILKLSETIKEQLNDAIIINNIEADKSQYDRAQIDVSKLNSLIDVSSFLSLEEGIKSMIK